VNEEALAGVEPQRHRKKIYINSLRVYGNRALRNVFGIDREDVKGV